MQLEKGEFFLNIRLDHAYPQAPHTRSDRTGFPLIPGNVEFSSRIFSRGNTAFLPRDIFMEQAADIR